MPDATATRGPEHDLVPDSPLLHGPIDGPSQQRRAGPDRVIGAARKGVVDDLYGTARDGTFDCAYGFLDGGGFGIANVDSHREALDLMADYPLYAMVNWEVRPLLEFKEGLDTVRAKLVEAQAAMAC